MSPGAPSSSRLAAQLRAQVPRGGLQRALRALTLPQCLLRLAMLAARLGDSCLQVPAALLPAQRALACQGLRSGWAAMSKNSWS